VRYPFIKQYQGQFTLSALGRVMQVARSGDYAWHKRPVRAREQANQQRTQQIQTVFEASQHTYGSPRIYQELREQKILCSEQRVARLLRLADLKATQPRRLIVTTHRDHALPVAENLLDRQFASDTPDTRWTTEISSLWTSEGWLYLGGVLDLFSRRIVGWARGETLERSLVLSALDLALKNRHPKAGLVCHSDRGSQDASGDYQQALRDAGIVCSMSRRGNCWDNAVVESFFSSLKREWVHRYHFATRSEARIGVFDSMEVWDNRKRRHSALGDLSPDAFEKQSQQQPVSALAA
jgi:putative transposase